MRRLLLVAGFALLFPPAIALMVDAGLGVGPLDVAATGLAASTSLTVGVSASVIGVALLSVGFLLGRKPGPATAIGLVTFPVLMDGTMIYLSSTNHPPVAEFTVGYMLFIAAIFCAVHAQLGLAPVDTVTFGLVDKGLRLAPARVLVDVSLVVGGFVLGGQVGAGTLVVAFATGPTLSAALRRWPPAQQRSLRPSLEHPPNQGAASTLT